jgi:uncharacterized membrane protein
MLMEYPLDAAREPPQRGDAARPSTGEGVGTTVRPEEVTMSIGPVQVLVLGFAEPDFKGDALKELERLRENDVVRMIDLLVVKKNDDGSVEQLHRSDLTEDEKREFGAIAGALMGYGMAGDEGAEIGAEAGAPAMAEGGVIGDDEIFYLEEMIPPGMAAAVAVIEHRWAIDLRNKLLDAGGVLLGDAWVHPRDLVAVGIIAAEEAAAH